jgi:hypothetical protein
MKSPDPTTPKAAARKRYSKPEVRAYGTIRAITRNAGNKAANPDGAGMNAKTS